MHGILRPRNWGIALVFAVTQCTWTMAQPAVQKISDLADTSLASVPEDAAFYASNVNMRAAWEQFLQGNFVTRLRALPFGQRLEAEFINQWNAPQGQMQDVKAQLQNPTVRDLLDLATDMNSHEVFAYGGNDWCEFIDGLMSFTNDMYDASLAGPEGVRNFLMDIDPAYIDGLKIPTTVVGFRLSNDELARTELDALEGLIRLAGGQVPELQPLLKKLVRKDFADGQSLSLELTADMIPMAAIEDEEAKDIVERLKAELKGRKLSISIGVKSKILLLAVGEGSDAIKSFGDGPSLLEHERVASIADQIAETGGEGNLRSLAYASKEWRESQWYANYGSYFTRITSQFVGATAELESEDVDMEEWHESIQSDAEFLDEKIAELAPEFDAMLSWSFASDVGREGYAYDWSENVLLENAAPMSVLKHAGDNPLFLMAVKQQAMPVLGEIVEAILDRAPDHLRNFILVAEQEEDKKEVALDVLDNGWPLLKDAYGIVSESILPALDSRESLFAIAAQWTTAQLSPDMPAASQPLPLPEFAGVIMLTNRDQFLSGCREIFDVFDQFVEVVRDAAPDSIPESYKVPRPQSEELEGATRFSYSELGSPLPGFEPQVIVSNDAVIYGFSDRQVRDLLPERQLTTRPAWLTADSPVASVGFADWAGMAAAFRPWISYALEISTGDLDAPLAEDNGPVPTGNDILQVWDCLSAFGKSAATTVVNEDATVLRWVWVAE